MYTCEFQHAPCEYRHIFVVTRKCSYFLEKVYSTFRSVAVLDMLAATCGSTTAQYPPSWRNGVTRNPGWSLQKIRKWTRLGFRHTERNEYPSAGWHVAAKKCRVLRKTTIKFNTRSAFSLLCVHGRTRILGGLRLFHLWKTRLSVEKKLSMVEIRQGLWLPSVP